MDEVFGTHMVLTDRLAAGDGDDDPFVIGWRLR
jgi:hypothetical protein